MSEMFDTADLTFEDQAWHVCWVAPNCERKVFRALHDLDLAPYLPRRHSTEIRQGRKLLVESPRYPGYVFLLVSAFKPELWDEIREIDGFGGFLRHGEHLATLCGMQLASAIMADILDVIRSVSPSDPLFISKRKKKREMAYRRFVAKQAA